MLLKRQPDIKNTYSNILTKNMEGQTFFILNIFVAGLSVVENSAQELLFIVEVRSSEVHHRGHRFGVHALFNVTCTGGPRQNCRKNWTGRESRAVQPHWSPFLHLQAGWSYGGFGQWIWEVKWGNSEERHQKMWFTWISAGAEREWRNVFSIWNGFLFCVYDWRTARGKGLPDNLF